MILSLLYRLFPKAFHKLVFESQRKPVNFEKLHFQFVDSNGIRYYKFADDFEIPISRKGRFEQSFLEFDAAISSKELELIISAMDKAFNRKDKKGNPDTDLGMIGYLINEIKLRKSNLIHPDIMFEMVASLYVREDENPAVVDEEIMQQKVEQFKKDSQGGLYDFFYSAGLTRYIPFLEKFKGDFTAIMEYGKAKAEAMKIQLENYTTANV